MGSFGRRIPAPSCKCPPRRTARLISAPNAMAMGLGDTSLVRSAALPGLAVHVPVRRRWCVSPWTTDRPTDLPRRRMYRRLTREHRAGLPRQPLVSQRRHRPVHECDVHRPHGCAGHNGPPSYSCQAPACRTNSRPWKQLCRHLGCVSPATFWERPGAACRGGERRLEHSYLRYAGDANKAGPTRRR